ncbi:MAG: dodecin domain-containing protein [Chloroflexi bacterium]|nr:dodecin domain-containing protein [Chloroflexota bacterium]
MSVVKVISLVGSSTKGIEDAIKVALSRASLTLRGIERIDVEKISATIADNQVREWHVEIKVAFPVLEELHE